MKTLSLISILTLSVISVTSISATSLPSAPPSSSSVPTAEGLFAVYFQNIHHNGTPPCATGQAITNFVSAPGPTYLTPGCSYLFWSPGGVGGIQYTGNVNIAGDLTANNLNMNGGNISNVNNLSVNNFTTANINTTNINGSPITNYVSVPNLAPTLTPGRIPKATFGVNMLGDSHIYDDGAGRIGIGTTSPGYTLDINGDVMTNDWYRSSGNNGWYSQTHGGGIHMIDSIWLRVYNDKSFWNGGGVIGSNGGLTIGYGAFGPPAGGAIIAGNVGIGTSTPGAKLDVNGKIKMQSQTVAGDAADTVATKGYVDAAVIVAAGGANSLIPQNGYAWNGPLLFQWGKVCPTSCGSNGCTFQTFYYPIPFPTAALQVVGTKDTPHGGATRANFAINIIDRSSFSASTSGSNGCTNYIAIGH